MNQEPASPQKILEVGMAFWAAKALLSAVELGLFTELARGPQTQPELAATLGLAGRGSADFFDGLVALGFLERNDGRYSNTREADLFLDKAKPSYIGGILEMANARIYEPWGHLTEALRTGKPQAAESHGEAIFQDLYKDPAKVRQFASAMTGVSMGASRAIAQKFDWSRAQTFATSGRLRAGCRSSSAKLIRICAASGSTWRRCNRSSRSTSRASGSKIASSFRSSTSSPIPFRAST